MKCRFLSVQKTIGSLLEEPYRTVVTCLHKHVAYYNALLEQIGLHVIPTCTTISVWLSCALTLGINILNRSRSSSSKTARTYSRLLSCLYCFSANCSFKRYVVASKLNVSGLKQSLNKWDKIMSLQLSLPAHIISKIGACVTNRLLAHGHRSCVLI